MIRVCAWCKRVLGFKEPLANPETTHGICEQCTKIWYPHDGPTLRSKIQQGMLLGVMTLLGSLFLRYVL